MLSIRVQHLMKYFTLFTARVKDECGGYYQAGRMQRTVHMHVLGRDDLYRFNDVTMIVHMTSERTDKLYRLALRWSG